MKIGITGASGFVGSHLIKRFQKLDHNLSLISRSGKLDSIKSERVEIFKGTVDDIDALEKAFTGCDIVYHLVGLIVETRENSFEQTVSVGTQKVVEAAKKAGVTRIVYISALGTSENAKTAYHRTKYKAEQAIINSGIDYVIFRPSVIYGPGDGFVSMLSSIIRKAPMTPVIGDGKYLLQPVSIDDLTLACERILNRPQAWRKIIDIAGEERLEYLEILNIIKSVLKINRPNFFIPITVMKFIGLILEKIMKPAPLTKDQMIMLEMGNIGDITSMKGLLEIDPKKFEIELLKYMR